MFSRLSQAIGSGALALGTMVLVSAPDPAAAQANSVWYSERSMGALKCQAEYAVTIKTANKAKAGTDSNITLEFTGYKGRKFKTNKINKYLSGNILERNDKNTLYICMNGKNIGHVQKLTIRSDTKYSGSGWMPEYVSIKHPDGKTAKFTYNLWVEDKNKAYTKSCSSCVPSGTEWNVYKVEIKTSTDSGAGTDSNISLSMIDSRGNSERVRLNQLARGNIFENNDLDTFTVWTGAGVGPATSVQLESDGKYSGADWHVATVTLTDKDNDKTVYEYRRWINNDTPKPDQIGRPRVGLANKRSIKAQTVQYLIESALGDDGWTYEAEFKTSSERSITVGQESGSTIGAEATVAYGAGDSGGWEGSVTASYERTSGKSLEDLSTFAQEVGQKRTVEIKPNTLRVMMCTWNTPYDVYDITGTSAGLKPVGFITGTPQCSFSAITLPTQTKVLSGSMVAALQRQKDSEEVERILTTLKKMGVTVETPEQGCFKMVQGKVAYNQKGSKEWSPGNVKDLCKGTKNPRATVGCFQQGIAAHNSWKRATKDCEAS